MGKARVCGSNAKIYVYDEKQGEILIGEVDKFSAKDASDLKKYRSLGTAKIGSQAIFGGWEISCDGGKVDWKLAQLIHAQDERIANSDCSAQFFVIQTVDYFDGIQDAYRYDEVTFHGYELDSPIEEMTEKFNGFSGVNRVQLTAADESYKEAIKTKYSSLVDYLINKKA